MQDGLVMHLPGLYYSTLQLDYLLICSKDACAAKILKLFEAWAKDKQSAIEQAKLHNTAAIREGQEPTHDESGWMYNSIPNLERRLLFEYSEKTVRKALKLLEDKGFITTRHNPQYKWDRTKQYYFQSGVVQRAIFAIKPEEITPYYTETEPVKAETLDFMHLVNLPDASGKWDGMHPVNLPDQSGIFTGLIRSDLPDDPNSLTNSHSNSLSLNPPPTQEEREREPSLKPEENSQRSNETPRLRSDKKTKSLHKAKNPDSDTQTGGVAVAKIYEIEPGVVNQDFLEWRSRYYVEQGGKWAKAPVSNALSDIQKSESRALALWQDYQNSIARQSGAANQPLEFSPAQMTDRQHKDWAQEYQANSEEFMAKPEAAAWLAYVEARPSFKEMIFGGINNNGTTAQQGQLARIQRKEATAVPNRGGRGDSGGNSARSRGSDEQGGGSARGGSLLREFAQDCLQDLLEPL